LVTGLTGLDRLRYRPVTSRGYLKFLDLRSLLFAMLSRVYLSVGNRPYRPGSVTVSAGYQPGVFKIFGFEFKKLKNEKKISKNTS
jgi:hypothetical protein